MLSVEQAGLATTTASLSRAAFLDNFWVHNDGEGGIMSSSYGVVDMCGFKSASVVAAGGNGWCAGCLHKSKGGKEWGWPGWNWEGPKRSVAARRQPNKRHIPPKSSASRARGPKLLQPPHHHQSPAYLAQASGATSIIKI